MMYTREILAPRASPIEDGKPLIGTWSNVFERVDLLEIRKPFNWPLPRWARNFRIKEWQSFAARSENIILHAVFCNFKFYRIAQIIVYDKENGEKFTYRTIKPGMGWTLPKSLANSLVDDDYNGFNFRIHNWLDAGAISLDVNIEAAYRKPALTVHLAYDVNSEISPLSVSLGMGERRSMYACKAFTPIQGDIVLPERHIKLNQENCSGFFCDYKGFFPYFMHTTLCSGAGFDKENRRFGFHIAENQTRETNKNNENALWVDGKLTPLPPVLITMPNGPDSRWVIQDVEGMVDLTFSPKEQNKNKINAIITKADFIAPFGNYNGMLMDCEGRQIQIKNLLGMGEKLNLRV